MHPEGIWMWFQKEYGVMQASKWEKHNPKSLSKGNFSNTWERVGQLTFQLTAVGHIVPWKSWKQWNPGLVRGVWVPLYSCGEEISQKDLVTYHSLLQSVSYEGCAFLLWRQYIGIWPCWFLPQQFISFPQILERCVNTSTSLKYYGRPKSRKECLCLWWVR